MSYTNNIVQDKDIARYLDCSDVENTYNFQLCGQGWKKADYSGGAKNTTVRYINSASETSVVSGYAPSISFDLDYISSETTIACVVDTAKKLKTGGECVRKFVEVDTFKTATATNTYPARMYDATISVDSGSATDGNVGFSGTLPLTNMVEGTFNITSKTFTANSTTELGTLTVATVEGSTTGKSLIAVSPAAAAGHSFKYKTGTAAVDFNYDDVLTTGWTSLTNGTEITPTSGDTKITVAEVDGSNKAVGRGAAILNIKA